MNAREPAATMSVTADHSRALRLSPQTFRQFAEFITGRLGIQMSEAKIPMLQSRLLRRLRSLGLASLDDYQRHLFDPASGATELAEFIDAVTTNKTDFLREPEHFRHLTSVALPALDPGLGEPWAVKLWCAGCSTGEEACTLAMALSEFGAARGAFQFEIFATDISTRVLAEAQAAIYPEARIEPVPEAWRKKYLLRSRDRGRGLVRLVPALRQRVQFQRLNFMDTDFGLRETFDVIFFRNVMIYFDKPTQAAVVRRMCRNLRGGGFLYTSHSESLMGLDVPLRMVAPAVYLR